MQHRIYLYTYDIVYDMVSLCSTISYIIRTISYKHTISYIQYRMSINAISYIRYRIYDMVYDIQHRIYDMYVAYDIVCGKNPDVAEIKSAISLLGGTVKWLWNFFPA